MASGDEMLQDDYTLFVRNGSFAQVHHTETERVARDSIAWSMASPTKSIENFRAMLSRHGKLFFHCRSTVEANEPKQTETKRSAK
jgi:hypothetical protein